MLIRIKAGENVEIADLGEFGLIKLISSGMTNDPTQLIYGVGDDAAVLPGDETKHLLFTTDMLVEEVHFSFGYATPFQVGWKTVVANVSDIAAMGGQPSNGVLSIAIPKQTKVAVVQGIYDGIRAAAQTYGINIVGGDTVKTTGPLVINLAQLGWVQAGQAVYRRGAQPEDVIMVSGTLGDAAGGLQLLQQAEVDLASGTKAYLVRRHLEPQAQCNFGAALGQQGLVSAMNDVSDGLASEVLEIAQASKVGCRLMDHLLPISVELHQLARAMEVDPVKWALFGGEDFELVFTAPEKNIAQIQALAQQSGQIVTVIGKISPEGAGCLRRTKAGQEIALSPGGYNHFNCAD